MATNPDVAMGEGAPTVPHGMDRGRRPAHRRSGLPVNILSVLIGILL